MASLDGEGEIVPEQDRSHLSTCSACQRWLADYESMTAHFEGLTYPDAGIDLWSAIESRIQPPRPRLSLPPRLWLLGGIVLSLRALQLLVDLPVPILELFAPAVAAVVIAAVRRMAGGVVSIETWAPELRRGDV
jgi:hypothetical protein